MSILLVTIALAFVIILIATFLLGISWILTGKSKIQGGTCGRDPTKKRKANGECEPEVLCHLCEKQNKKSTNDNI